MIKKNSVEGFIAWLLKKNKTVLPLTIFRTHITLELLNAPSHLLKTIAEKKAKF